MRNGRTRAALFATAFFVVISVTILASRFQSGLALVWFGTAVGIGWLTSIDRSEWKIALPVMACASALATALFGFGPRVALPLAVINVFESWLAARLLLAARPQRDWLDSVAGLTLLVAVCGVFAPVAAGIFGAVAASTVAAGSVTYHFTSWLTAHALGTLIGLPIVFFITSLLGGSGKRERLPASALEFALHMAAIIVVSAVSLSDHRVPLLFLPTVPLLFAAFRCGQAGSALGIVIVGTIAVVSVQEGTSVISTLPFDMRGKLFFLQFYLATLSLLAIPCSVALRQHRLILNELAYRKAVEQLIAENSDDALVNLDEHGLIRLASPAGARFTGIDDLEGLHLDVFFDPLDAGFVYDALDQARLNPQETIVIERPVAAGDGERWLEAKLRTATMSGKEITLRGFAVTIRDVTARKLDELEAIQASETDALTSLPNRRFLIRRLERALADLPSRPIAFAIIDLDLFKAINDMHGHVFGDDVLRAVAQVMSRHVTPTRSFARLGGEEFALLDLEPDFARSEALCEELRREIAALRPLAPRGVRLPVTASIGLKRFDRPTSVTEVLQATDTLLYRAKHKGRNRVESEAVEAGLTSRRRAA